MMKNDKKGSENAHLIMRCAKSSTLSKKGGSGAFMRMSSPIYRTHRPATLTASGVVANAGGVVDWCVCCASLSCAAGIGRLRYRIGTAESKSADAGGAVD